MSLNIKVSLICRLICSKSSDSVPDNVPLSEFLLGSVGVGKGGSYVLVKRWVDLGWWNILVVSDGGRLWNGQVVAHHSLNNSEVIVRGDDLLVNSEVWNKVVLWGSWLWLLGWDNPLVVLFFFGSLGELESISDVVIFTEVWHLVVDTVATLVLILVVSEEAMSGLLGSGTRRIVHNHHVSSWGMVMVVLNS